MNFRRLFSFIFRQNKKKFVKALSNEKEYYDTTMKFL